MLKNEDDEYYASDIYFHCTILDTGDAPSITVIVSGYLKEK